MEACPRGKGTAMPRLSMEGLGAQAQKLLLGVLRELDRRHGQGTVRRLVHGQRHSVLLARVRLAPFAYLVSADAVFRHGTLSPRELEAARCAMEGCPWRSIGQMMNVSESTGVMLRHRAYVKLGVSSLQELRARFPALYGSATAPGVPSEDRTSILHQIRISFDSFLGRLVLRLARDIGEPDLRNLFFGRVSPLVLADLKHEDCGFLLRGVVESTRPNLTPREQEMTPLLACGLQKEAIAQWFGINVLTIKTHARAIFSKYCVHSWEELAACLMAEWHPSDGPPILPLPRPGLS